MRSGSKDAWRAAGYTPRVSSRQAGIESRKINGKLCIRTYRILNASCIDICMEVAAAAELPVEVSPPRCGLAARQFAESLMNTANAPEQSANAKAAHLKCTAKPSSPAC
ncbi:MAG: hypothetical protein KatS3mg105_0178 [Gemmatales bacterium]|nr:MAG: hypothetical protein KatS3mg105_0178 [Gemmatales bacterium]